MKIAVCYSGLYRPWNGWLKNHKTCLPKADYYYTTWSNQKKLVMEDPLLNNQNDFVFFEQPEVNYNTYDGEFAKIYGENHQRKDSEKVRLYTANLQHHGHWKALSLCKNYDVVIRMRYDTILGNHDWYGLCKLSYETGNAIGIGNTNRREDENKNMSNVKPQEHLTSKIFMTDFMNIHKQDNIANVDELHENKNLWPTNAGWYQILSKPGWGHKNFVGGIQLARYAHQENKRIWE